MKPVKVLLADNNRNFRVALRQMLLSFNEVEVVGEASNGIEFLNIMKVNPANLVFIDYEMPEMNGLQAIKIAMERYPDIKIIGIPSFDEKIYIRKMIEAGAKNCISKNKINYDLISSIIIEKQSELNNLSNINNQNNKLRVVNT